MLTKTYQLLHLERLSTVVVIADKVIDVIFDGGTINDKKTRGKYTTEDREIQGALEARKDYGHVFKCVATEGVDEALEALKAKEKADEEEKERLAREKAENEEKERLAKEKAQKEADEQAEKDRLAKEEERLAKEQADKEEKERLAREEAEKGNEQAESGPKVYDEPNTVQEAKEVLVSQHQVPSSHVRNKEQVLAKAAELNVQFPNLA